MNEIPKSVEEAADLAEALHAKMYPQEQAEQEVVDPTPEEVDVSQDVPDEPEQPTYEEVMEQLRVERERYNALKGKYDKEVPTLSNELKEFKQTVFERLEQARQPEVKQDAPAEDKFAKFREEYGDELFEAIRELSGMTAEEKLAARLQPVQDQVTSVEDTQIKVAQNNFVNYLDQSVKGDWKKLWAGEDQKFIEFLQQPDPSGLYTYGELVQVYNDNWDGDKLAKVFNNYFEVNTPKEAAPKQPRPEQNAMVAPNRSTQHATPNANDKMIWTQDAMAEFQRKDRQGAYSPEESKAKWDDLLSAMSEGRIR